MMEASYPINKTIMDLRKNERDHIIDNYSAELKERKFSSYRK